MPFTGRFYALTALGADDAGEGEVKGIGGYMRHPLLAEGDTDYKAMWLERGEISVIAAAAVAQAHAAGVEPHKRDYDCIEPAWGDEGISIIFSFVDRRKRPHWVRDKRGRTGEIILVRDGAHLHALSILKIR